MSIRWHARSDNDGFGETEAMLYRGDRGHAGLGVVKLIGGSEVLLTVAELRELASVATLLADQIEALS